MAETLTELIARIKTDSTELEKGLTDAEKQTEASSKKMADSLKKVGTAMAASGAAITAALGLMGKAAIDEQVNIARLNVVLKGVGVSYDNVKDSLEAVISTTQKKTGIADSDQRDTLGRLILVTKDYDKALSLLPTVLDLATAGQMDASTAATYLGQAYLQLEQGAKSVGIRMGQATVQFKNMAEIQNSVAGAAEAAANPLSVLKATIGDLAEEIGTSLLPIIKDAINKIVDISIKIQDWVEEHPALAKVLTITTLLLGTLMTILGTAILIIPIVTSHVAAFGVVLHAALGPIGVISLAISGLIIWIGWLVTHMEEMQHFWDDVWSNIKQITFIAIDAILAGLEKLIGWLPFFGDKITEARNKLAGMIASEEVQRRVRDVQKSLKDVNDTLKETTEIVEQNTDATKEQTEAALDNIKALEKQKIVLEETTNRLKRIRAEYEYSRSDAGRLNISIKDVTFALFDMGKSAEEITNVLIGLGEESDDVNAVLKTFNLTAQQVNDILNQQKESVDNVTQSLKNQKDAVVLLATEQAKAAKTAGYLGGGIGFGGGETESGMSPYQVAYQLGYDFGNLTPSQYQEIASITGVNEFASGGTVPGTIGQPQLALVHGGETVIPFNESMGNVVVNFTQPVFFDREDTMNKFVDKISKTLDRKYRLSGRSLS